MPEREREQRKALRLSVTLLHPSEENVRTSGVLTDVSRGGAYVATYEPLSPGAPVVIEIEAPGRTLQIPARVVHDMGQERSEGTTMFSAGMGLRFERPDAPEVAELIERGRFLVDDGGRRRYPR